MAIEPDIAIYEPENGIRFLPVDTLLQFLKILRCDILLESAMPRALSLWALPKFTLCSEHLYSAFTRYDKLIRCKLPG